MAKPHILRRVAIKIFMSSINMNNEEKIIGTFVPLDALHSTQQPKEDAGTFAAGLVFLDWLKKTKQNAWQLLPLHETQLEAGSKTKHIPSPYKSYSIGLDPKYLPSSYAKKQPTQQQLAGFQETYKDWIEDYALFCALRDHFGTDNWLAWDESIRLRKKESLKQWTNQLRETMQHYLVEQWRLHQSYRDFRQKADSLGIVLVGDLPFYPSLRSPLVWVHQDIFQIEQDGTVRYVSGVPNSYYGRQIWGHPLYNWHHEEKVIAFWKMRMRYHAQLFTHIRFDHVKAFFSYGVLDLEDAKNDHYEDAPGVSVFKKIIDFGRKQGSWLFVENSGQRTEILRNTLKDLDLPGMKIFRFGINHSIYADVSSYPKNCVAYTTTHDTETLLAYLDSISEDEKKQLAQIAGIAYSNKNTIFATNIRTALIKSPAQMVIIPLQDWLLTTDRINTPGTEKEKNDPNWQFRLKTPIEKLPHTF